MERRRFLKRALIVGATLGVGGVVWTSRRVDPATLTVEAALITLDGMVGRELSSSTSWTPAQVLSHCAQGIEYSLQSYPELKSPTFRGTLGAAAFGLFRAQGWMTHNLTEAIPGAPGALETSSTQEALERLRQAFVRFGAHRGALAPHFAYGDLSHEEYTLAHVMHLNNHLEKIRIA